MNKRKVLFARVYTTLIPRTLEDRLKVWGLLLILIPSLLILVSLMMYQYADEQTKVREHMEQVVAMERVSVTLWAENKLTKVRTLANSQNAKYLDKEALAFDLEAALRADNKLENLIYVNKEGRTEIDFRHEPGINVSNQEYFRKAIHGQPTTAQVNNSFTGNQSELLFCWPVYNFQDEFQGAIIEIVPLSAVDAITSRFRSGQTGETFLVDQNGERFTRSRFMNTADTDWLSSTSLATMPVYHSPAVGKVLGGECGAGTYYNHRGSLVIGVYQWIDELNWGIIGEVEESEILGPIRLEMAKMLLIYLMLCLIAIPLTFYVAQNIRKPVDRLLKGVQQIKKLKYSVSIDKSVIDSAPREFKRLCTVFNQMAATINEHRTRLEEMISERTCALQNAVTELQCEIDGRHQAEVSLQQSEQKYRTLFDKATDAIFLLTVAEDGSWKQFAEVNEKACRLSGYTKDELLQMSPSAIDYCLVPERKPMTALDGSHHREIMFEATFLTKSGDKVAVEMNVHRITVGGQPAYLGIARDITLRRKMEEEMARLDRLNLVGEMAASIGHEVRNPMTTVRGFLQMLGRKNENAHNIRYFNLMIEELDRANSIITEFLSLAKNKVVDLKQQNINTIIQALHPLLKADALIHNKDVLAELEPLPDIPLDEKEIRQLIINLARNGVEAMPEGARLTIRTYSEDGDVVLAVDDQGPGIPEDVFHKMGTPFFTTKENGTGLGLAVCYSIANRHNAVIIPRTGPDGTTFFVRFKKATEQGIADS